MKEYLRFLWRCLRVSFVGDWRYHLWMLVLTCVAAVGLHAYVQQFVHGLAVTGLSDQVSWGLYIGNFTYLVGIAAAAAMLVIPVYVYRNRELEHLVIFGQLLAVSAVIMALLFVVVDLGRPDRGYHLMLRFNFPSSMLSWDAASLNGYLLLNLHICGYLIYSAYRMREPSRLFYVPFVFLSIVWAVGIQTIEAFLYVGLGSRPFWNSAIIVPRLLSAAFSVGPSFLIMTLGVLSRYTLYAVPRRAFQTLRNIITVSLTINLFLLICEVFAELYADTAHAASTRYLWTGLHGHGTLVPWIWTSLGLTVTALVLLYHPVTKVNRGWLFGACGLLMAGVWIDKALGLVIPAFVPSPLGEIVEYKATLNEVLVSLGIWAGGLMIFTVMVRITIPVLEGRLTVSSSYHRGRVPAAEQVPTRLTETTRIITRPRPAPSGHPPGEHPGDQEETS